MDQESKRIGKRQRSREIVKYRIGNFKFNNEGKEKKVDWKEKEPILFLFSKPIYIHTSLMAHPEGNSNVDADPRERKKGPLSPGIQQQRVSRTFFG